MKISVRKRGIKKMKTVVIYSSQTGFTKRYAEWIAEAAEADSLELALAKKKDLSSYNAIVFGGWACAGSIRDLKWFKCHMDQWTDKKLIVFCVGGSPMDSPEIEPALKKNFTETERMRVNVFYCPGGFCYEKMSVSSRLMMRMFLKALKAKKGKTEAEEVMVKMISSSYDISDRKYTEPILKCLRNQA